MALSAYRRKRRFERTPEPRGRAASKRARRSFVVQKHDASRLHYDFRLEHNGVLLSWAVPKGPSLDPSDKRLAVQVEDHPVEYGKFEGTIPKGEYGGGTVMLWDRGTWSPLEDDVDAALRKGKLTFTLKGSRLRGAWTLARMRGGQAGDDGKSNWLLIKQQDDAARTKGPAATDEHQLSISSKRSMEEIAGAKKGRAKADRSTRAVKKTRVRAPAARSRSRGRTAKEKKRTAKPADSQDPAAASKLAGAAKAPLPRSFSPQLCVLASDVPRGEGWVHEIKFDGYRVIIRKSGDDVRVLTRTGKDWSAKFGPVVAAAKKLDAQTAMLDGELVVHNEAGQSSFALLQRAIKSREYDRLAVYLFDLPYLDGFDLCGVRLLERKELLRALLAGSPGAAAVLRYSDHIVGEGEELRQRMCDLELEGAVSKRADSLYEQRRSPNWVKTKCSRRQEFVIVGFTPPEGNRKHFGSLLLAAHDDDGRLIYTGKVGTGFDAAMLRDLADRMSGSRRRSMPLDVTPPRAEVGGATWVTPKLVAEVQFTEWTRDGRLRHPSFQGLREDKEAKDVRIEKTQPVSAATARRGGKRAATARAEPQREHKAEKKSRGKADRDSDGTNSVAGIEISSGDRVVYPDAGLTKIEVARYYAEFAPLILPYIRGRPLSTVRCPQGRAKQCFFQKHVGEGFPKAIESVRVREKSGHGEYITIDSVEGLVSLVQFGVLEIHPWGATNDDLEHPDLLTFDLDPGEGLGFAAVREAALKVREVLGAVELESFVKTSGGKGLHVCVPLRPITPWEEAKSFARAVAELLAAQEPERYLANMSKAQRGGRIFIDYLRNGRGATSVAPYSTRARPNAPISMPLRWEDLGKLKGADAFTLAAAMKRGAKRHPDPWKGYFAVKQELPKKAAASLPEPARRTDKGRGARAGQRT